MATSVLSFDVGLRNLAAALVRTPDGFAWPDELRTYASADETKEAWAQRALAHFLQHGWVLDKWDVFDVTEHLTQTVKNVKRLGLVTKVTALRRTLERVVAEWGLKDAEPHVAVEVQHNANTDMRGVSMGIVMFFLEALAASPITALSGSHKLKVCDALGVHLGEHVRGKRGKYEDNKARAVKAVERLLESKPGIVLPRTRKRDDLCDALLQGLWHLWCVTAPPTPRKRRRV